MAIEKVINFTQIRGSDMRLKRYLQMKMGKLLYLKRGSSVLTLSNLTGLIKGFSFYCRGLFFSSLKSLTCLTFNPGFLTCFETSISSAVELKTFLNEF